jgi:hypothetical protein
MEMLSGSRSKMCIQVCKRKVFEGYPELEFLDIDKILQSYTYYTKNPQTRKLESFHEQHFVERKN